MALIGQDSYIGVIVEFLGEEEGAAKLLLQLILLAHKIGLDTTGLWSTDAEGNLIPLIGDYHWKFQGEPRSLVEFLQQVTDIS